MRKLQIGWAELAKIPHTANRTQTEWRMTCPYHAGTNPTSFSLDLLSGKYHCFSCGVSGRLTEKTATPSELRPSIEIFSTFRKRAAFNKRVSTQPDIHKLEIRLQAAQARLAQPTTRQGASRVREYLAWRRIRLETVRAYGGGYEPGVNFYPYASNMSKPNLRGKQIYPALIFPLHEPVSGQLLNLYARGLDEQNYTRRLHHVSWGKKGIFNPAAIAQARRFATPLYLTEGIFDALALAEAGYTLVMALVGFTPFQPDWFKGLTEVVVAFDNDSAGQHKANQISVRLRETSINCTQIELPGYSSYKDVAQWWQNQACI